MTIILAAVVMAIEKATAIQEFDSPFQPTRWSNPTGAFHIFTDIALILSLACLVGILGWVILFRSAPFRSAAAGGLDPPASGHPAACASEQAIVRALSSRAVA